MKCATSLGLAVLLFFVGCGCGQDLRDYSPVGPSGEFLMVPLGLGYKPRFVTGVPGPRYSVVNLVGMYNSGLAVPRSATWGFRTLCALVNRYFGDWERLVIIERLSRGGWIETGFIAVAVTRAGPVAVTNFDPQGPDAGQWNTTLVPRTFTVDRRKFESCLAELNKAPQNIKRHFLWYGNTDLPIYFLHDIRLNRRPAQYEQPMTYFSFGFCAWAAVPDNERARLLKAPCDYATADDILSKYEPWQQYDVDSEADRELRQAGAPYASLLSLVWECTLGRPDYTILGVDPLAPPPAKSASSLEHERGHSGTPTAPGLGSP